MGTYFYVLLCKITKKMNTVSVKQQSMPLTLKNISLFSSTQQGDLPLVTTCKQFVLLEMANNMGRKCTAAMNFKNLSSEQGSFQQKGM